MTQQQVILLLTVLVLAGAEVFTKPKHESWDCRGNVCGGPLICPAGYELQCRRECSDCQELGENYTSRSTEFGGCGRHTPRSQCCTCTAPQLPPQAHSPVEVNSSCHNEPDCLFSASCMVCDSTLVCPEGYSLSSPRRSCGSCGAFGDHYVQSSIIHRSYMCHDPHVEFGSYRSCRTCEPVAEPITTTTEAPATEAPTTTAASGGDDKGEWELVGDGLGGGSACRGDNSTDNSESYYQLSVADEIGDCKARCASAPVCFGIEFGHGRCEVWTRAIGSSASVTGFECLRYAAGGPASFTILP